MKKLKNFEDVKNKYLRKLLEEFDKSSKSWGWESDQGTGQDVINSENLYNETKDDLVRYLNRKLSKGIKK